MRFPTLLSAAVVVAVLSGCSGPEEGSQAAAAPAAEPTAAQEEQARMAAEKQAALDAQANAARDIAKAQQAEREATAREVAAREQEVAAQKAAEQAAALKAADEAAAAARAAEEAEARLAAEAALKASAEKAGIAAGSKESTMAEASDGNVVAEIETTAGTMVLGFFPETAPGHVKNFVDLATKGFYDGTRFHRTIKGFMIQGGDPFSKDLASSARWGTGDAGYKIKAEFSAKPHQRGTLSMARSNDPDSAGSQFFICHQAAPHLDRKYTVFGELLTGYDVLDTIATAPVLPGTDRPKEPVQIVKVTIRPRTAADVKEGS